MQPCVQTYTRVQPTTLNLQRMHSQAAKKHCKNSQCYDSIFLKGVKFLYNRLLHTISWRNISILPIHTQMMLCNECATYKNIASVRSCFSDRIPIHTENGDCVHSAIKLDFN